MQIFRINWAVDKLCCFRVIADICQTVSVVTNILKLVINEDIWWEIARTDQYRSCLLSCRLLCVILPEEAANWNTAFITDTIFFFISLQIIFPRYYFSKLFNTRRKLLCFLLKGMVWYFLTLDHGALEIFARWVGSGRTKQHLSLFKVWVSVRFLAY